MRTYCPTSPKLRPSAKGVFDSISIRVSSACAGSASSRAKSDSSRTDMGPPPCLGEVYAWEIFKVTVCDLRHQGRLPPILSKQPDMDRGRQRFRRRYVGNLRGDLLAAADIE